jgi:AcrR family transcriptional regulator
MNRYGLGVSMRDVALEAGLSRGSLYRYFGDREALVDAVLERTADRFVAKAASRIDGVRSVADELAEAIVYVAASARRLGQGRGHGRGQSRGQAREHGQGSGHGHGNRLRHTVAHLPADRETPLVVVLVGHPAWVAERWTAFWRTRLAGARERGELRPDLDLDAAAEHVTRLLLSFALVPEVPGVGADVDDRAGLGRFVDEMLHGLAG